ncbi:putative membrane protein [Micromonospora kangleipakensis]|uniref:Putative membrane protein n=1 Tax=Micromonospora kangleipakensis TaxID=1077942 RepID=A0A4V2GCT7_9ACTN|nr:hypothetical protein [Micromonospora kangleipakensis]RZU73316.1 putative membrane protein [Micromonospora kangleipakensis]
MTVTGQDIADYVDRVRAALADLPPAVRDELTEDLPEHLAEVAAEADGSLVDRLGEPEAYAAELRAAAGAGEPLGGRGGPDRRIAAAAHRARARLSGLDVRLGPLLGYAKASEFLRLLRPAWWVLRGWLAALLFSAALGEPSGLLPRLGDSAVAGLFLLAGGVLASVWLGHRSPGLRGWPRRLLRLGTAALLLFSFAMLVNVDQNARSDEFGYQGVSVGDRYDSVQDVFVYDSEGRLVENARLFDQNGVPIRLGYPSCVDPAQPDAALRTGYPYCPQLAPFRPRPPAAVPVPPAGRAPAATPASPQPTDSSLPTAAATPTPVPTATVTPAPTSTAPVPSPTG